MYSWFHVRFAEGVIWCSITEYRDHIDGQGSISHAKIYRSLGFLELLKPLTQLVGGGLDQAGVVVDRFFGKEAIQRGPSHLVEVVRNRADDG